MILALLFVGVLWGLIGVGGLFKLLSDVPGQPCGMNSDAGLFTIVFALLTCGTCWYAGARLFRADR